MFEFYKGKKVFITGHTGFKGTWLAKILVSLGAKVTGYSLPPQDPKNLFEMSKVSENLNTILADIRELDTLKQAISSCSPDIIFHMAAQPLVRLSYKDPVLTYETNVLGTVNVLEAARLSQTVRSVLNVTTDKVYKNIEIQGGYKETDELMGRDPYSNSKSCSELLTYSYKKSFFDNSAISVSTARSGNVIGGGDFAADRIIPDAVRAIEKNKPLILRYPNSIRPYQHVIESLFAYLLIACKQYGNKKFEGSCNIGPDLADCICSKDLIDLFFAHFAGAKYKVENNNEPYESKFLRLDTQKMKEVFLWKPLINIKEAVEMTAEWTKVYLENGDIAGFMDSQICKYRKLARGIFA